MADASLATPAKEALVKAAKNSKEGPVNVARFLQVMKALAALVRENDGEQEVYDVWAESLLEWFDVDNKEEILARLQDFIDED